MAWSVNDIMNMTKFLTRKAQAGSISASDIFYAWNTEQRMYHQDLVGRWQARASGKSGANTGLIENETVFGSLAPFTKVEVLAIAAGVAPKPPDFIFRLSLTIGNKKVDFINRDMIPSVLGSVIDPPSAATGTYYASETLDGYSFLPDTVTTANLDYIADVTDVVWGFTIDGNGRQVYDAATSVQPLWNNNDIVEITKRTLTGFGVSFKDRDFDNYGRTAQNTGD